MLKSNSSGPKVFKLSRFMVNFITNIFYHNKQKDVIILKVYTMEGMILGPFYNSYIQCNFIKILNFEATFTYKSKVCLQNRLTY